MTPLQFEHAVKAAIILSPSVHTRPVETWLEHARLGLSACGLHAEVLHGVDGVPGPVLQTDTRRCYVNADNPTRADRRILSYPHDVAVERIPHHAHRLDHCARCDSVLGVGGMYQAPWKFHLAGIPVKTSRGQGDLCHRCYQILRPHAPRMVIVGEGPPPARPDAMAFSDERGSGGNLARLMGMPLDEVHRSTACVNLLSVPMAHKPSRFPRWFFTALHAESILPIIRAVDGPVVTLGRAAREALGGDKIGETHGFDVLELLGEHGRVIHTLPHPSGRSRMLNDAGMRDRFRSLMRDLLR